MPKTSDILLFRSLTRNKQYFKKNTPVVNNELPQVLKDKLKSDGKSKKVWHCNEEMSSMLLCLKNNDFSEVACSKEVAAFVSCQKASQEVKAARKAMQANPASNRPGDWTTTQINAQLEKYPQPRDPNYKFPKGHDRGKQKVRRFLAK